MTGTFVKRIAKLGGCECGGGRAEEYLVFMNLIQFL